LGCCSPIALDAHARAHLLATQPHRGRHVGAGLVQDHSLVERVVARGLQGGGVGRFDVQLERREIRRDGEAGPGRERTRVRCAGTGRRRARPEQPRQPEPGDQHEQHTEARRRGRRLVLDDHGGNGSAS
jgi:hypothetical protein